MLYVVPKLIFESFAGSVWASKGSNQPSYIINKTLTNFQWRFYVDDAKRSSGYVQSFDLAIQKCNEHWIKFLLENNYICPVTTTSEHNCDN